MAEFYGALCAAQCRLWRNRVNDLSRLASLSVACFVRAVGAGATRVTGGLGVELRRARVVMAMYFFNVFRSRE